MTRWNTPYAFKHDTTQALADDVHRAILSHIRDHIEIDESRPQRFVVGPTTLSATTTVVVLPRVARGGLSLGDLTFIVASQ